MCTIKFYITVKYISDKDLNTSNTNICGKSEHILKWMTYQCVISPFTQVFWMTPVLHPPLRQSVKNVVPTLVLTVKVKFLILQKRVLV